MLDGECMLDEVGSGQVDSIGAAAWCWPWGKIRRRRRSGRPLDGTRRRTDRQQQQHHHCQIGAENARYLHAKTFPMGYVSPNHLWAASDTIPYQVAVRGYQACLAI